MATHQQIHTLLLLAVVLVFVHCGNDDEIKSLPGLPHPVNFKQYAGYLTANETNGRTLFYWLVESQNNPDKDPVVLWMNGGPGCSSLTGFSEHGPFAVNPDGKTLRFNDYSWNKISNVIYLETPAGVGFSYSEKPDDYLHYNDNVTADDNFNFLLNFFDKYPQLAKNDFYISGESYASHYIITLAHRIHTDLKKRINLKGFMIGNGVTFDETDANAVPPYMAQHSLIPLTLYEKGLKACKGNYYENQADPDCASYLTEIWNGLDNINPYYLYDSCPVKEHRFNAYRLRNIDIRTNRNMHPLFTMAKRLPPNEYMLGRVGVEYDAPCTSEKAIGEYMNLPEVKEAIHATRPAVGGKWLMCNYQINEKYDWTFKSMLPFYDKLSQYKILVFTGDVDLIVTSLGTQMALDRLGRSIITDWKSWKVPVDKESFVVGGFYRKYSTPDPNGSLALVTIRGAGHMVGIVKPRENLELFRRHLNGEW